MTATTSPIDELVEHFDSPFFAALAEPVRVAILRAMLVLGEASDINTITKHVPQDRSGVSRHLKVLLDARVVTCTKVGRHKYYAIDGGSLLEKLESLLECTRAAMPTCCPPE